LREKLDIKKSDHTYKNGHGEMKQKEGVKLADKPGFVAHYCA